MDVMWSAAVEPNMQAGQDTQAPTPTAAELQAALQTARKELHDVRKELASKTVQLARKEQALNEKNQTAEGSAAHTEMTAQLTQLAAEVNRLSIQLAQKEEELGEARRLAATQKKALREAAFAQGAREAAEHDAAEASKAVAGLAVEEEIERLSSALAAAQTRSEIELAARDEEIKQLRTELSSIDAKHKQALAAAESALMKSLQQEKDRIQAESHQRLTEYEREVSSLRNQLQEATSNADSAALLSELAMLNNQKVQVQREFEAYKDMSTQAQRKNREEVARLLEENATLHSRLAAARTENMAASNSGSNKGQAHKRGGGGHQGYAADGSGYKASAYATAHKAIESYMPQFMRRFEQDHRGMLPVLVIGGLVLFILLIAITRAAVSTRSQHSGPLCFLAKLGISIGPGCSKTSITNKQDNSADISSLLDRPNRIHDVNVGVIPALEQVSSKDPATGQSAAKSEDVAIAHSSNEGKQKTGGGAVVADIPDSGGAGIVAKQANELKVQEKGRASQRSIRSLLSH